MVNSVHGIAPSAIRRDDRGEEKEDAMNQNPEMMNFDDYCDCCAATLHDDEKVERWGGRLCDDCAADTAAANPGLGPND
jgi:hypothetical protein